MKKFLFTVGLTAVHYLLLSQGIIRGKVIEGETHEALAGATIAIKESSASAIKGSPASTLANNDGTFLIQNVKPGKLTLIISYVGYEQAKILVEVVDDSTSFVNVLMNVDVRVGSTVVLTATARPERVYRFRYNSSSLFLTFPIPVPLRSFGSPAVVFLPFIIVKKRVVSLNSIFKLIQGCLSILLVPCLKQFSTKGNIRSGVM